MTLEIFDPVEKIVRGYDLLDINALNENDRQRLSFYLDLKDMCYPLFRGQPVNWSEAPWNFSDGSNTIDNEELYEFITSGEMPCLAAAILYNLKEQIWHDEEFSSVARQKVADTFYYGVERAWKDAHKSIENRRKLEAEVSECASTMWYVDNHIKVGKLLGFGSIEQNLYDAFDTYIDKIYSHKQVSCAKELGKFIRENIDMETIAHDSDKLKMLQEKTQLVMDDYGVTSPAMDYTMSVIFYEVLNLPIFEDE